MSHSFSLNAVRLSPCDRRPSVIWLLCRSTVYSADLESALHYLLRVELATHNSLEGEELKIFKDFVILVTKVK